MIQSACLYSQSIFNVNSDKPFREKVILCNLFNFQLLYNLCESYIYKANQNKSNHRYPHMKHNQDLASWAISDPQNKQDYLPQPYRLIDQVLNQTIVYNLNIAMHQIQEKKKNQNYQGKVPQHFAQNLIEIQHVCCLSSKPKYQNYLLAGDKFGNVLLVDMAKKSVASKKQLIQNKRVTFITECTVTDGQNSVTSVAVILNSHPIISILRYKHADSKLFVCEQVVVTSQTTDLSKFPYECQIQDQGRLLVVKTFQGTIEGYSIPEIVVDYEKIKSQNSLNDEILSGTNQTKKQFLNPLQFADISIKSQKQIRQKKFQLKFSGYQKPLKYKDLLTKIKNKQKQQEGQPIADTGSKKESKKDSKKVDAPPVQAVQKITKQIEYNTKSQLKQAVLQNGVDVTEPYKLPKFRPFAIFIDSPVQYPRKKSFQKGGQLQVCQNMIYGWTNTKQFYSTNIRTAKFSLLPIYSQYLVTKELPTQQLLKSNLASKSIEVNLKGLSKFKNVYPITCVQLSNPQQIFVALGLQDGTVALWNTKTMTLQYNLDKHEGKITKLRFFQNWKLISGSDLGQIHIDNILDHKKQVKRTNIFQPKTEIPITDISVNDLGIAFVMDGDSNLRVYDLWRNQKISRISSCNNFAIAQNKGRKWINSSSIVPTSTVYSNRDFTIVLSIKWPSIPNIFNIDQNTKGLIEKAEKLKANPWTGNVSGMHIIRNFQFLLQHFQGLQNVYKKGYEKMKILNLFTNLQFAQLYDRNFDIPDFGHNLSNSPTQTRQLNKSSHSIISSQSKFDKTSKDKLTIGLTVGDDKKKVKLTSQVLHPQKFLFQRRKIQKRTLMTQQNLIQTLREQHKMKDRRQTILKNDLAKTMI